MTEGINGISNIGKISIPDSAKTDGKNDTAEETSIWDKVGLEHSTEADAAEDIPTPPEDVPTPEETEETTETQTDQNDESKVKTVFKNISKIATFGATHSLAYKAAETGTKIGQNIRNIITGGDEAKAEGTEENTEE